MKDKQTRQGHDAETNAKDAKKAWQPPKLAFVKPKVTKHGAVKELTGGFFGTFRP
jgi:hypothetical protein